MLPPRLKALNDENYQASASDWYDPWDVMLTYENGFSNPAYLHDDLRAYMYETQVSQSYVHTVSVNQVSHRICNSVNQVGYTGKSIKLGIQVSQSSQ